MKKQIINAFLGISLFAFTACDTATVTEKSNNSGLAKAYENKFLIGAAMNLKQIHGKDQKSLKIIEKHFNSIVAENCMKSMFLQPIEGQFFFDDADRFVEYGLKNNHFIIGHTLIWHSQAPKWFFYDQYGQNVTPEVLKQRMKNHITTIVSRYKGKVKGWDVVNEAILEDGSYRKSKFYEILGEEFIPLAFQYAHEADPNAELYYNDYNEWHVGKRKTLTNLIKEFKTKGIRIDGVGMQAHFLMDSPSLQEYEETILDYANAGVKLHITEMDISPLPSPWGSSANISETQNYEEVMNPYKQGLPKEVEEKWAQKYVDFFTLFNKHQDKINRVTTWGVSDGDSWKNDFPIKGRTDYTLLFNRQYEMKPVVNKLIEVGKNK